ncbi:MAG: AAA family ATPase [Gammaproteobacteria bacterium]|nr:AAA family ATPase [Gammaproteobacteria bacterium]
MTDAQQQYRLSPEQLYHRSELQRFDFATTADLKALSTTIGQERALQAIEFGVSMPHCSFNLYVMGSTGLGRHTLVREALQEHADKAVNPSDWCYITNFQRPHTPQILQLPAGTARRLRADLRQLISDLLVAIPAAFQGDEYQRRHTEIMENLKHEEETATQELGRLAAERSIVLLRGPTGFTLTPQKDKQILSPEQFNALPKEEKEKFLIALEEMKDKLKETMSKVPEWQHKAQNRLRDLDRETMKLTVTQFMAELERKYREFPSVLSHLADIKAEMIENADQFRNPDGDGEQNSSPDDPAFRRYGINILVDNAETHGAPVVFEDNPTYQNLIGRIEHVAHMGTLHTDFTLIKAGALHQANGGFLILDADKVLLKPFAWEGLKRVLAAQEIRIESVERQLSLVSTISLEPQPIPIHLKVVLIGSRRLFYLLKAHDPEFSLLFKVAADFSEELPRENDNELLYARLIATLQHREGLRRIDRDGVGRIIEYSARRAWDSDKLSLHMGDLVDLLREADYQAAQGKSDTVRRDHIQAAIDAQAHRASQLQEQLWEEMLKGVLRIDTSGSQLAQVNGLTFLQLGDYSFGAPTRITATARLGSGELIDIERESEQGGPVHSKGVMILTSYLAERYAKHQPLSLSASLVFEQTYSHVEGDSASAAELCALISAMADVPIRQTLAITGSINQHGQMQAIGGVCEKIEGFFDLCHKRGLSGKQGVIIPRANVRHLMLKQALVDAAADGRFHIYAVDHVEQALGLLTGLPAGVPDGNGIFPEGSVNHLVQMRLAEWIALRQHYASPVTATEK